MLSYVFGYLVFIFGSMFYLLSKIQEYKDMAKANPKESVQFSFKAMFNQEWINLAKFYLGGIALVWLLPYIIGGATVEFKTASGFTFSTVTVKVLLMPLYFFFGYSGNSALFSFFGKYKKTLLNQVGVDDSGK